MILGLLAATLILGVLGYVGLVGLFYVTGEMDRRRRAA